MAEGDLAETRELAAEIAKPPYDFEPSTMRKGVIISIQSGATPPSVTVTISGDTVEVPGVQYVRSYHPVVSDTVVMMKQGSEYVIFDAITTVYNGDVGNGLTRTGDTLAVGAGDGITVNTNTVALATSVAGAGIAYASGVLNIGAGSGIQVNANDVQIHPNTAGAGLDFGGNVLNVGEGWGLNVAADFVEVAPGGGLYTDASGVHVGAGVCIQVDADSIRVHPNTAGAGLNFTNNVLNVGAGNAITVGSDTVAVTKCATPAALVNSAGVGTNTGAYAGTGNGTIDNNFRHVADCLAALTATLFNGGHML